MHTIGLIIDSLLKIVSNPTSNLTGAVLLLAMLVLVLLILAVAALITILPGDEGEEEEAEEGEDAGFFDPDAEAGDIGTAPPTGSKRTVRVAEGPETAAPAEQESRESDATRRKRDRLGGALLFALPAILVVAGVVWGWYVTGDAARCSSCHATAPYVTTWRSGDHAHTGCLVCHEDGGIGVVPAAVTRVSNALVTLSGANRIGGRTPIPAYRCLRCHADVGIGVVTVGRVKVSHKEFLAKGYACARCHEGVGHSPGGTPQRAVDMGECVGCHDGHLASARCPTCHVGDTSSAVRVDRAVFPKADITPRPGCTGCHETKTCLACHGVVMPHPAGFETGKGHARLAAFEGKQKLCYRCHLPSDCLRCHKGDFSTHGPNWKKEHPSGVPLDGRNACACHSSPNFCGLCHVTSKK